MSLRAVTVRLLIVGLLTVGTLTASPAPAATPSEKRYATKIHKMTNNIRDNHDRVRLSKNRCLKRFANRQAARMAKQRRLFHQDLNRIQGACGVGWVGENVAYGPFTARQMVRRWMRSPGHRANILRRQYRISGVGVRRGGGYWWASHVFGRKG